MPSRPVSRPIAAPVPAAPAAPAAGPAWLRPVVLVLAAIALLSMFSGEVGDADTWFHLRTGAYVVQSHKLPAPDPFSWTTYMGQPAYPGEETTRDLNLKHEWGAQVILYLVYAAGGFPAMVIFKACCLTFLCGMIGWVVYRRTDRFYLSVAAAVAAGMIARTTAADRPYLVTYVFLAITLWILERRRPLWVLPPLFILWANAHGGYFMGWVLLGGYCGEALFQRLRGRAPQDEKTLWAASLLAILASGLNPTYFNVIPGLFAYQHSTLQRSLKEWHPASLWPPSWYSCLLVGAAIVLLWTWRRVRVSDVLLFAVFAAMSLMAQRNIIFVGIIAPIVIASYLPEWKRPLPQFAEFAVPLLLLVIAGERIGSGEAFQLRAAEWQYPAGPVKFLKDHNVTGPVFNIYEWGGYLMWAGYPELKTFVDGRALNESVFQDYMKIALNYRDAQPLLDKYGVQVLVLQGFEYWRGTVYMLGAALSDPAQSKWKLVYQDKTAMVFVRQPPPGVQPLKPEEVFTSLDGQCTDHLLHEPGKPGCAVGLADLYRKLGRNDRSTQWLAAYDQVRNGTFHATAPR
uniref:Glycosyltransferase RgtA/B/C/D-like domain-containing protein n=1 Tax=Solibacter usitatus (strain Ellin6076) TaxID=234267 RepID=Q020X3_SOLUE